MSGLTIHPDDFDRIDDVVRTVESGYSGGETGETPQTGEPARGLVRFVLAEPLNDGEVAVARATRYRRSPGFDVAIVGDNEGGHFTLRARRQPDGDWQQSDPIDVDATAAQARTACRTIDSVGAIDVGLGRVCHPVTGVTDRDGRPFIPGRWSFHFPEAEVDVDVTNGLAGTNDQALVIRRTRYGDAGWSADVHNAIPIGTPTPLRAGAVIVCAQFSGAWGVISAEPRDFTTSFDYGGYYGYYATA